MINLFEEEIFAKYFYNTNRRKEVEKKIMIGILIDFDISIR